MNKFLLSAAAVQAALFVAAADRFGLRPFWTWLTMTALIGCTLSLAVATDVGGLPALPAIAIGFLLPNADLIWHALRRRGRAPVRIYGRTDASFYDLEADVIEPWDNYVPQEVIDDLIPSIREECTVDGKLYSWPFLLDVIGINPG